MQPSRSTDLLPAARPIPDASLRNRVATSLSVLAFSIPVYVVGYMLILVFAMTLRVFPVQGYVPLANDFAGWLRSIILPSVAMSASYVALVARMTRTTVADILAQDYIRVAIAKGIAPWRVTCIHALRNAAIPIGGADQWHSCRPHGSAVKRGAKGAIAIEGKIPDNLDDGVTGAGFPVAVFNVLGAGDVFFSGLLKGWLDGENWPVPLKYANACGAFAVSRHGCTPAYPSLEELNFFLRRGVMRPDLRNDPELEQLHWSTNRHGDWSEMRVFAFDHRMQLEAMTGYTLSKSGAFKELCLQAALRVQNGQPGYGILCDDRIGKRALYAASGSGLWIGRPCEWPGSRPLTLEPALGLDCGGVSEWARENVVKVLCFCHPDDEPAMWATQMANVRRLYAASRRNRLEFLLEIIPSKAGTVSTDTVALLIRRFYAFQAIFSPIGDQNRTCSRLWISATAPSVPTTASVRSLPISNEFCGLNIS